MKPHHPPSPRRRKSPLPLIFAAGFALAAGAHAESPAEEAVSESPEAKGPIFVDATDRVGVDFRHFNGMTGERYFNEMAGGGGVLFDADRDGDLDLFVVQGHLLDTSKTVADSPFPPRHPLPLTDRFYRNELISAEGGGALRFVDATDASGLDARGYGMGAASADFDNDGWPDLYINNFGSNELWRNLGPGAGGTVRFENVTAKSGTAEERWSVSSAFFDADGDGWLDLYVSNYVDYRLANHKPCFGPAGGSDYCGPTSYEPLPDRLFRNRGDGTFEDLSGRSGISAQPGSALGVITGDFDADGRLDVYVANDGQANFLWRGLGGGRFEDAALLGGCAVSSEGMPEASMGVDAGDVDNDGDDDLFMAHLSQETNTLYLNDGTGFFEDATAGTGLDLASWAFTGFGTKLFDYDNDGLLDVVVVNGAVKTVESLARAGDPYPLHQTDQLFRNVGGGRFVEVTGDAGPAFGLSAVSRGTSVGDLDNDGDSDLVIYDNAGAARILLNQVGQDRGWIGIEAWDPERRREALGARVGVFVKGEATRWRTVRSDGSYASANDPRVIVGLGDAGSVEKVRVEWPGGSVEDFPKPATRLYHRLERGAGTAVPAETGKTEGAPSAEGGG
ncbi:MAG: CRTAC1 family protein [Acidobacteriota bacterium]